MTTEEFERVQRAVAEMRAAIQEAIPEGRYRALALTDLERSYLWVLATVATSTEADKQRAGQGAKP